MSESVSLIDRLSSQVSGVADAEGHADAVEVVQERDGELARGVQEILELDAFELSFGADVFGQKLARTLDGVAMEDELLGDAHETLVLDEELDGLFDRIRAHAGD